jgi:hypothetical protein
MRARSFLVRLLIIDALGVHHYVDAARPESSRRGSGAADDLEHAITAVLRRLLHAFDIDCYVSKCALFEPSSTSSLTVCWGFDAALRPAVPQDFMPPAWAALAPHVLVVYRVAGTRLAALFARQSGITSTAPSSTASSALAMSSFIISDTGLSFGELRLAPSLQIAPTP